RDDGVVGAAEARDVVEQDDDVALVFDETLGLFDHHFGDLHMARRRLVEGRRNDFAVHRALHVRHFLPTRGGATMRQRWPMPCGATMSMTRPVLSLIVGSFSSMLSQRVG